MPKAEYSVTAICTVTDPAERARRLARVFDAIERAAAFAKQQVTASGDVSEARPLVAGDALADDQERDKKDTL